MAEAEDSLLSLKYDRASNVLEVLDQLLVPHQRVMIPVADCEAAWTVIRQMQVRFIANDCNAPTLHRCVSSFREAIVF